MPEDILEFIFVVAIIAASFLLKKGGEFRRAQVDKPVSKTYQNTQQYRVNSKVKPNLYGYKNIANRTIKNPLGNLANTGNSTNSNAQSLDYNEDGELMKAEESLGKNLQQLNLQVAQKNVEILEGADIQNYGLQNLQTLLSNRQDLSKAILLSEILDKPLALRKTEKYEI